MDDPQLLRYSRQILLPQIDIDGQRRLLASRVLIIGLGGLGSPVALYLAAAGVGHLTLVDDDKVDLTNLQRQIIHRQRSIGSDKVASAAAEIAAINPEVSCDAIARRLEGEALEAAVSRSDLVIDCCDNFASRFAINAACARARRPLISAAAIRWEGQITLFDHRNGGPCYQCLYPVAGEDALRCNESGVAAPIVGILGSMQALEAIKLLVGCGETLRGQLLLFDGLHQEWRKLRLQRDPHCPICTPI
jgi:molybdopterin-synthase adenylyltransferase